MRNIWYPKKIAGYVTIAKLDTLAKKDLEVERDPNFASRQDRDSLKRAQKPRAISLKRKAPTVAAPVLEEAPFIEAELFDVGPLTVSVQELCDKKNGQHR